MSLTTLQPILDWIQQHPGLAGLVVFTVAAVESLAVVGILVPGIMIMLGVGALVGLGVLDLWTTVLWAVGGAVTGDGVSYWLGRHFDKQLRSIWPFTKHPDLIPRGERFFHKHGGKSILFGRFIGPIRPIIPAIAGIMHMNPYHFYFVNLLSAVAWAPVVLLPGVVFGSSLNLATAVAGRLVMVILLLVAIAWLLVVGLRTVVNPLLFKLFGRWESHWDFVVRNAFNSSVVLLALLMAGGGYYTYVSVQQSHHPVKPIDEKALWWQSAWQTLPVYRDKSDQSDPLTVQWWGDVESIKSRLLQHRWQPANRLSLQNIIMWLTPSPQIESMPILSKRFHGKKEALLLVKKLDQYNELILRLWPAYRPVTRNKTQNMAQPHTKLQPVIWVATVSMLELKQPYPEIFYPSIHGETGVVHAQLLAELPPEIKFKQVSRPASAENWNGSVILLQSPDSNPVDKSEEVN
ncbi:MAG: DedA family protein [Gammaproteobacteria bacterium]|nr:DedA family protein [Gammaproteobacteria bacterium]